ncbi:MAG TPA: response regulator transcription factor [Anaerolineales bacterium]|nr:response regulator transcription factor [Anaerolineales bacterium]
MRILVVDDHVLFRDGLTGLLKAQPDFNVVGEAGTIREAVEKTRELQPDVVLMDFGLPDGTGLEATQAILEENPDCKIVFLTVYEDDDTLFAAIRSGAVGYLLKNVPINGLLASLRSLKSGQVALTREMTTRLVREFSRTSLPPVGGDDLLAPLTRREVEIMQELATGASNREIAQRLFIAENTVKHHVHNILSKLGLKNRQAAIHFAREYNLS